MFLVFKKNKYAIPLLNKKFKGAEDYST